VGRMQAWFASMTTLVQARFLYEVGASTCGVETLDGRLHGERTRATGTELATRPERG
jgi:hypothetical protein